MPGKVRQLASDNGGRRTHCPASLETRQNIGFRELSKTCESGQNLSDSRTVTLGQLSDFRAGFRALRKAET